jgi:hypothetical protein
MDSEVHPQPRSSTNKHHTTTHRRLMMHEPRSRRLVLTLALIISCGLCATAQARPAKRAHQYTATERLNQIKTTSTGIGNVLAGELDGPGFGHGAQLTTIQSITGSITTAAGITEGGVATTYNTHGTERERLTLRATLRPDGTTVFAGTFRFTGGTGRYAGITGHGTFSGELPTAAAEPSRIATLTVNTTARY